MAPTSSRAVPTHRLVSESRVMTYRVPSSAPRSPHTSREEGRPLSSRTSSTSAPRFRSQPIYRSSRGLKAGVRKNRQKPPPYFPFSASTACRARSTQAFPSSPMGVSRSGRSASSPKRSSVPASRLARR